MHTTARQLIGSIYKDALRRVARREAKLSTSHPLVSFTFDDFPKTALSIGGAILTDRGLSGTYYAAAGLMGKTTEVGRIFDESDLPRLIESRHELACHTYSHVSAADAALSSYYEDVMKGEQALRKYLDVAHQNNFSYPFGRATILAKRKVAPAMRSCRGIFPGSNGPIVDLNLLSANSLYGGIEGLPKIQSLIEENIRNRMWLIFYTHDIQNTPSDFGCTPQLFEKVVRCAIESGSEVVTVKRALDYTL